VISFQVRDATDTDLRAIVEIYNASILTTTTWSERFQILPEREFWFVARRRAGDAVLVAERDGDVIGFAAYGEFRDNALWPGYRFTVENTVHVRDGFEGHGVGRALMTELLERARAAGLHAMIAAVDSENTGSIEFHERLGFSEVGRLPEIGWKHDRWLDLVLLQRRV
jgi:phosphinothricin acetyltransferase